MATTVRRFSFPTATGRWVDYEAGKVTKYDCGPCHMTAYSKNGNQDGRPGMVGTWAFRGITCEECRGPGKAHVAAPSKTNLKVERADATCGKCHIRGARERISAGDGFISHHEQYNELLASPHAGKGTCATCHDPHKRAAISRKLGCGDCHVKEAADFKGNRHEKSLVQCIEFHMPAGPRPGPRRRRREFTCGGSSRRLPAIAWSHEHPRWFLPGVLVFFGGRGEKAAERMSCEG